MVYGDRSNVHALAYRESLLGPWHDPEGSVAIPESDSLQVPLKRDRGKDAAKLPRRVYPLPDEAGRPVDEKFDESHRQGRMESSTQPTPFCFPGIVVWKTVISDRLPKRKGRVVVDISGLNLISRPVTTLYSYGLI